MQFNPKWSFYLGIAVTIEIAISHGTIAFTNAIPAAWIPFVVAWAGILAFGGSTVMTYMAAYSSAQAGPMVTPQSPSATPPKALIAALAIGLSALALAWAGPAGAQTVAQRTSRPPLTGNIPADINNAIKGQSTDASANALNAVGNALAKPFQDLANFIGDDSAGAVALATAIPELQDGHGQQCWMAMKQFGEVAKAHPVPLTLKLLTDVEAFRLMGMAANNLCANPHCTQVFADMSNAVEAMSPINSVPIPSLNALCSKVPQVSVAPPVTVPAVPATPATPAAQ